MTRRPIGQRLGKDLDPKAIDEVWARIEARRGSSAGPRRGAIFFAVAAVVAAVAFVFFGRGGSSKAVEPSAIRLATGEVLPPLAAPEPRAVSLDEGSEIALGAGAALAPTTNTGRALSLALQRGKATFDVTPNGPRTWTIDAGLATITVLGTRFVVLREDHRVRVDVERGHVRVTGGRVPGGAVDLVAGQWVVVEDGAVVPVESSEPPAPSASASGTAPPSAAPSIRPLPPPAAPIDDTAWHPLAKRGEYGAAYEALGKEGVVRETKRATTPAELLQVADVARLSGHPGEAVAPLERLLAEHAGDSAAPQAAFTLGKIRTDALGDARGGAAAFERAIGLGLPGALREDAFFRRVEAYAKAGDGARARVARAAYDDTFPDGRYRTRVAALAP